jgi:hypothetical protein
MMPLGLRDPRFVLACMAAVALATFLWNLFQ